MGFLKRFGKIGDPITLLSFSDNFRNIEFLTGFTKLGRYFHNFITKEGVEANIAEPINELKKGKFNRQVFPVYYDNGSGIFLKRKESEIPIKKGYITRYYRKNPLGDYDEIPESMKTETDRAIKYYEEIYPGLPVDGKNGTKFFRAIQFVISPLVVQILQDPRVIGAMVDSNIFGDAVQLKPQIWKLLLCLVGGFIFGMLF